MNIFKSSTSAFQKAKEVLLFKSLMAGMIAFTLLTASGGLSFGASDPALTKRELKSRGIFQIVYDEGALSVSLQDAELREVLAEISRLCHIQFHVSGSINEKMTLSFSNLPLEEGLKRLLKNRNYSLFFAKDINKNGKARYVISRVLILENVPSIPESNPPQIHKKPYQSSLEQADRLNMLSGDMIEMISKEDPKTQEEIMKAFADQTLPEIIRGSLEEIHTQLLEVQQHGKGQDVNAELDTIRSLIQEMEKEK